MPLAQVGQGLFGEFVELSGLGVSLDLFIEPSSIERLEPSAKLGEIIDAELGHGFFNLFDVASKFIAFVDATKQQFAVTEYGRQQVVEVMSYAARESSDPPLKLSGTVRVAGPPI